VEIYVHPSYVLMAWCLNKNWYTYVVCVFLYVCMCVCVCVYVCMYVCMYVRMHACMHACACVWVYNFMAVLSDSVK
jgi:hypothetical protein